MIKYKCSKCGLQLTISAEHAGKRVRCKKCHQIDVVPQAPPVSGANTPQEFMEQHSQIFEALLKHEKEAPAIAIEFSGKVRATSTKP
ncbi:MAG: TFIIB-type zinc ribbon-containing protein [Planctomycetota bacterium]|jgi:ribosomal protein S27AE